MKKVKYLLFAFALCVLGTGFVSAASLSVSRSKSTVVVGNTVTITVTASGAAGWEYCLNYDSSIFSLSSSTSDTGGACLRTGSTLTGHSKVTFKLKAIKSGSSTIGLRDAVMYGDDGNAISSSKGSTTVTAKTQAEIEASYSTNANLKSLGVEGYEITPAFDKDTLEYELEVENDIESVKVIASRADSSASVSGSGDITLSEGVNKVEVVVTAEKGNKKTYVINITRKELNPINVVVDGKDYTVVRKADAMEAPTYYTSTTAVIDDIEVPAFVSEITGYTLVGLKDIDGNISLYIFNNGEYKLYNQISVDGFVFVPQENTEVFEEYVESKTKIADKEIKTYTKSSDSQFVLVYGMNAKTGKTGWYQYDIEEGTFQRFQNNEIVKLQEDVEDYLFLVIVFGGGLGLSVLAIILLLISVSKTKKKNVKLLAILENGQVVNREFMVEEVKPTSKVDSKEIIEELDELNDADVEKASVTIEVDEEEENLSDTEIMKKFESFSDLDETKGMEKIEKEEVPEEQLSKRELRRREKEQKKKELKELEDARNEFFSDEEPEVSIFDKADESKTSLNEVLSEKKKVKKKKK
ncbi:MAG: cadherin-like beta sandwich domain-containing protein [Bacilli bacterium]|nr:cadherin-like beta sandwich domain-containing protein [Bacilli bacterium]